MTNTTAKTVKEVRRHFAAYRTSHRNTRLRRYQGRNSTSTHDTMQYHLKEAERLARTLPHDLEGKVWSEHRLALRISENSDLGNKRPELRSRIADLRREIKTLVAA